MRKAPVLTKKGKAIIISIALFITIVGVLLLSAWAYGFSKNMTFEDVMLSIFDTEKYDLKNEVVSLSKVKLDYENTIKDMTNNVNTQTNTIDILQGQIDKNNATIEELMKNENENANQIAILRGENESLVRVIDNLTDSNNLTNVTISMMSEQLSEINELLQYYIDLNERTYEEFIKLRDKNAELERELTTYQKMVADLSNQGFKVVTFLVNGEVHDVKVVKLGQGISLESVAKVEDTEDYLFQCWTLNGEKVNSTNPIIKEDTTFEARLFDIRNIVHVGVDDLTSFEVVNDMGTDYDEAMNTFYFSAVKVVPDEEYVFEFTACIDNPFADMSCSVIMAKDNNLSSFDGPELIFWDLSDYKDLKAGEKGYIYFKGQEGYQYFIVMANNQFASIQDYIC